MGHGRGAMSDRLRVGIVAGGRSAEHEVSVSSADSVLRAIDRERYEPYLIYIDREGRWHLPEGPAPELGATPLAEVIGIETPTAHAARLRASSAEGTGSAAETSASGLPALAHDQSGALQPRQALRSL